MKNVNIPDVYNRRLGWNKALTILFGASPDNRIIWTTEQEADGHDGQVVLNILDRENISLCKNDKCLRIQSKRIEI